MFSIHSPSSSDDTPPSPRQQLTGDPLQPIIFRRIRLERMLTEEHPVPQRKTYGVRMNPKADMTVDIGNFTLELYKGFSGNTDYINYGGRLNWN